MQTPFLPRGITERLEVLLGSTPVVVLEGARASGKTAIGAMLLASERIVTVADLGDPTILRSAESSTTTFVDQLVAPAFIDEAQLLPELLLAIKRRVDRDRRFGSFVLTGSSRLGRAQLGGSDPLAGRSARLRLWPMTQGELSGTPVNLVETLFSRTPSAASPDSGLTRTELIARIRRGGLPNFAGVLSPLDDRVRVQLMAEYVEGVLQHEVGRRHDRSELVRLFRYLAATTSRLLNVSNVANDLAANRETISQRLAALESSFLLHALAAHRPEEHRSLIAHPKIHATDVGLAAWAARVDDNPPAREYGAMVETFVVNELAAQAGWSLDEVVLRHWRDTARKLEVDTVLLHPDGTSIAIEVKGAADVRPDDLAGLRHYLTSVPGAKRGVVFYTGALTLPLGDRIWAVPITTLWNGFARAS